MIHPPAELPRDGEATTPDTPMVNTDRELWREVEGDYYAPSIHVTQGGGIGMNVGGYVLVLPIREWVNRARLSPPREGAGTTQREEWVVRLHANGIHLRDAVFDDMPTADAWFLRWEREYAPVLIHRRIEETVVESTPSTPDSESRP